MGKPIREAPDGLDGLSQIAMLTTPDVPHAAEFSLEGIGALEVFVRLLTPGELGRGRSALEHGHDGLRGGFVRERQVEGCHAVIVLKVEGVGVGVDEEFDGFGRGLVGCGHVEGEGAVLVADGGALGVSREEELDGVDGGLPHGGLVDGEVADVVGLGGSAWVGLEEGVDDFLRGLERACCVQGEVAAVVELGCFFDEDWLLLGWFID